VALRRRLVAVTQAPLPRARALGIALIVASAAGCAASKTVTSTVVRTTTVTATETLVRTQKPEPTIYVPEAGGTPEYKPANIYIGASSSGYSITKWLSYGGPTARAIATFDSNDCTPTCAQGHITTIRLTILLSQRTPCKGVPAYAQLAVVRSDNEALMNTGHEDDLSALCREG
jgi:hypothetical protein